MTPQLNKMPSIKRRVIEALMGPDRDAVLAAINEFLASGQETDNTQRVLAGRLSLDGKGVLTLDMLGSQLGISKERVRQIEERVYMEMLRDNKFVQSLETFRALEPLQPNNSQSRPTSEQIQREIEALRSQLDAYTAYTKVTRYAGVRTKDKPNSKKK